MHRLLSVAVAALLALTAGIFGSAPAAAQSASTYDVFQWRTSVGPLAVAYRRLTPSERGSNEYTHEIWFAHPIWGYARFGGKYSRDCAGSSGSQAGMVRWDGSKFGDDFERRIDEPIEQLLTYEIRQNLFDAIQCGSGPMRLNPTRIDGSALNRTLQAFAGRHLAPWRLHTLTREGRRMHIAAPGTDNIAFGRSAEFEVMPGRAWGGEILIYNTEPGVRARHTIDHVIKESGAAVVSRRTIVNSSAYQLEQVVSSEAGVFTVSHALVCLNRPGVVYGAFAEYSGLEEQQLALRFVNSMEVTC
ncbi:MAG TPA: hypothetical protein VFF66_01930 [Brevundimonas sp.]|nr:hypothetical protein [Brevundimonas sp.]